MNTNNSPDNMDLSRFDSDFADAAAPANEYESIPDGKYQVVVDKVEITTAKTTGNPLLKWTLKVIAPKCQGRLLWRNNVMLTRENIRWLKGDLHTCGLDLEKLSDLPVNLERLLDVKLEITKRTKGDNENIYFNRRIVTDDADNNGSTSHGIATDIIPF